jgi:hypothetical protein
VIIAAGKFNGVIAAHTPTGSLLTTPYREYSEYRSARARPLGVDVRPAGDTGDDMLGGPARAIEPPPKQALIAGLALPSSVKWLQ